MFKIADLHGSADSRHAWGDDVASDNSGAKQLASNGKASGMRKKLVKLDKNGDGTVCADEINDFVEAQAKAQNDLKQMKMLVRALLLVVLLTLGATLGLTYTLLIKTKETSVSSSGTMMQIGTDVPVATRRPQGPLQMEGGFKFSKAQRRETTDPPTPAHPPPPPWHVLALCHVLAMFQRLAMLQSVA